MKRCLYSFGLFVLLALAFAGCGSQSAGPTCMGLTVSDQEMCLSDYRRGFEAGRKRQEAAMDSAYRKGLGAGLSGLQDDAASDPDSNGDCRTQWVESYHRGYYQGAHSAAK